MTAAVPRYHAGDRVVFYAPTAQSQYAGTYVVERLLPPAMDGLHYVIKRAKDGHEHVAAERELGPVVQEGPRKAGTKVKKGTI